MKSTLQRKEPGFGWTMLCSVAIHLTCFILLVEVHYYAFPLKEGPVYYVDVVNMPVAKPQAGTLSKTGSVTPLPARKEMVIPAAPPQKAVATLKTPVVKKIPLPARKEMPILAPSSRKAVAKLRTPVEKRPHEPAETSRQFEERMANIEQEVAEKHTTAALEVLQKKVAGAGKAGRSGIPGGRGIETGSNYAGFIRSRLTDAFRTTIAFQTKNPEVMVSLTIDRTGKVAGLTLERSSNDRIFEDAVMNAIVKAEQTFVPPPGGGTFEHSFKFVPEGVSKK